MRRRKPDASPSTPHAPPSVAAGDPDAIAPGPTAAPRGEGADRVVRPTGLPEDAILRVIRVPPEHAGSRLDRFLQHELRNTSRSRSQQIIARGAYRPDGRRLRKSHRLVAEQRILLWRELLEEPVVTEPIEVLHEDRALLAVNKPAMMTVHPTARVHRSTVVMRLEQQRGGERLRLLHRLDRETSGVLLLARTPEADRTVKAQFEARERVVKRYLALAWGSPAWERFRCELPLEPDLDCGLRVKMRIAEATEVQGAARSAARVRREGTIGPRVGDVPAWTTESRASRILPAATTFEVCGRRRHPASGRPYALLRCTLHTGRQHQIRVHLAALGMAVVGDKLYGPDETIVARAADGMLTADDLARLELPRHALHAESLELDHPTTSERLRIVAPMPEDMAAFWNRLSVEP